MFFIYHIFNKLISYSKINNKIFIGEFVKTNPQLDFNPKPILKLESNAKLT